MGEAFVRRRGSKTPLCFLSGPTFGADPGELRLTQKVMELRVSQAARLFLLPNRVHAVNVDGVFMGYLHA